MKTAFQIFLLNACLMIYLKNDTINLMLKLLKLIITLNFKKLLKRVSHLLKEESKYAVEKNCKVNIKLNIRFLKFMHIKKRVMIIKANLQS
jgi:hypothetical protein